MARYSRKPISDAERRLGELLESAPDAILELDDKGRIVLLNRMAEQLFGSTREELLGQTVDALVPEALRNAHKRHRTKYLCRPPFDGYSARVILCKEVPVADDNPRSPEMIQNRSGAIRPCRVRGDGWDRGGPERPGDPARSDRP